MVMGFLIIKLGVVSNLYLCIHFMYHFNSIGEDAMGNYIYLTIILSIYLQNNFLQSFLR